MRDALAEAKRMLGEDAVVLHTKQYETPSLLGMRKKQEVEILAASDSRPAPGSDRLVSLEQNMEELKTVLSGLAPARQERPRTVERLVRNGMPDHLAEAVLAGCDDSPDCAIGALGRRISCTGPIKPGAGQARVAIVGPTGVGKTTTAAKLAAKCTLGENKRVALLTLDTYRVGAVEQLATYARLLDIPMEVALSPEDGDALVKKHADKDLIIIDTVGRSQRNREHISELATFLRAVAPTEVHLALSASASSSARKEAVESFGALNADRLILTKLDECSQLGCIAELAMTSMMPFSYITYGQDVPDDISVAERKALSRLVWEGAL
ncbi:MAG: flagellar biosynthesis protein FlhF [Armatimonadota bacterium]